MKRILFVLFSIAALSFGCSNSTQKSEADHSASEASAHLAHDAYVQAINSNNLDSLLEMLTDDIVFMYPNESPLVGKDEVKPWVEGYLEAFKTNWDKPVLEFVVNGDWAFERYSYAATDSSLEDGSVYEETGWGLAIYHRDADGKWRVARDAWGPDIPAEE